MQGANPEGISYSGNGPRAEGNVAGVGVSTDGDLEAPSIFVLERVALSGTASFFSDSIHISQTIGSIGC